MTLLCPVLKGYIHKSKNYSVFKLIVIEQNSEFYFDFLLVAAPGFFLILPWSHKVMLLEQTSCTFSKGGALPVSPAGGGEGQRLTGNHVRLPWMDWEKLQPIQSWLMWCDFATHSVVCGSGFMTWQVKLISHEKRGEAKPGEKTHLSIHSHAYIVGCWGASAMHQE